MNRGEAVHTVQRAIIHYGKIPLELVRHDASLAAVSYSLTLLTDAMMAWNTLHMQHALDAPKRAAASDVDRALEITDYLVSNKRRVGS